MFYQQRERTSKGKERVETKSAKEFSLQKSRKIVRSSNKSLYSFFLKWAKKELQA